MAGAIKQGHIPHVAPLGYKHKTLVIDYFTKDVVVRKATKEAGGTMPEELSTPQKSLKQVDKEKNKQLKNF